MALSEIQSIERIASPTDSNEEIDLLRIGRVFWRRRFIILATVAVTTSSALVASFLLPKIYATEATILPISGGDVSGALAAGLSAQLGAAAGMLGGLGGIASSKTADLVEILSSRTMAERVTVRFHLDHELKGWRSQGDLVNKVKGMVTVVAPSMKTKVVDIKVEAPRPELAVIIANAYVSELKGMLDEIGYNSAAKNRKFIENQLTKTKVELTKAENSLSSFQAENHLASLPETVVASIKSISDLEAQRIGATVQLKTTDEALSLMRSKVSALQADPNALLELELKRRGMAAQEEALTKAKDTFLGKLTSLPPKGMALARLQRDVQVQTAIYLALSQQYESAIINENRDSDAFLSLDKAEMPNHPIKPKKLLFLILGLLSGLLFGALGAFIYDLMSQQKENGAR